MPSDPPPYVLRQRREVGNRIRTIRTARGLTQERLALDAGVSRQTVYRAELATHSVTLDALLRMACALGVPIDHFFRDWPTDA